MSKKDAEKATAVDEVAEVAPEPAKKSRWMELLNEAMDGYEPGEPYPFDGFGADKIIYISPPDTADRALAIINLCDLRGDVDMKDIEPYIKALLGENFDRIWPVFIGPYPVAVAIAFAFELQNFFFGEGTVEKLKGNGADKLPGGSQGSSN